MTVSWSAALMPSCGVAILMLFVAWKVFKGSNGSLGWQTLLIGGASLFALIIDVPAPLVIFFAGLAGVFLFR